MYEVMNWNPGQVSTWLRYLHSSFEAAALRWLKLKLTGKTLLEWKVIDFHKQLNITEAVAKIIHEKVCELKENYALSDIKSLEAAYNNGTVLGNEKFLQTEKFLQAPRAKSIPVRPRKT
eukprot:UN34188